MEEKIYRLPLDDLRYSHSFPVIIPFIVITLFFSLYNKKRLDSFFFEMLTHKRESRLNFLSDTLIEISWRFS